MGILLEKMGRYVAGKRSKWITLAIWILIAVILSSVWPAVNKVTQNNAPNLGDKMPSVIAGKLAEEQFPSDAGIPALFVFKRVIQWLNIEKRRNNCRVSNVVFRCISLGNRNRACLCI